MIEINSSPIQKIKFLDNSFFIKRDDLLNKEFSGNKARKFHYLLLHDFKGIDTIVSHGGIQSNAMYSLSVLAKMKNLKFVYYSDHVPTYLIENPIGNFKNALKNGMILKIESLKKPLKKSSLFIPQGGAFELAEVGIKILANEIKSYMIENDMKTLDIFLPSGTGTTALYLQKNIDQKVYTCACVGDEEYLKKQFSNLIKETSFHPTILTLDKKYHFAKPYREFYDIWLKLKLSTNIEFDLLYDPLGWLNILKNRHKMGKNLLYIHQGGVLANESMILRYKRKFDEYN